MVDPLREARPVAPFGTSDDWRQVLQSRDEELRTLREEVRHLRSELRAIHTSSGWAALRTLSQVREALAPRGGRRDRVARLGISGLRRLKRWLNRFATEARTRRARAVVPPLPLDPEAHAVICLPIIEWTFRFQRPQQLMRRFAATGHKVFYAANHFHAGHGPRLRFIESNVDELFLPGDPAANVYHRMPTDAEADRMADAVARLRDKHKLGSAVVVVQLPFWHALAERLRERFDWPIIYDCIDDHSGFHNNSEEVLGGEARLVAAADLVVASSEGLHRKVARQAGEALLLRNACDYQWFRPAAGPKGARGGRPVVGYYGAISEWFDSDLVVELARHRSGWRFELIGSTLAGDAGGLETLANVRLLGERPYVDLPRLIRDWDVFIIPFKRVRLTEATNPVKVYEMLATGKPVVAVPLPELVPMAGAGLIRLAEDATAFSAAIADAMAESNPSLVDARQQFARENTWECRHATLAEAIARVRPMNPERRRHDPSSSTDRHARNVGPRTSPSLVGM